MGLGGVAIAVPPYVIHPKTAVLGRAGGGNQRISDVASPPDSFVIFQRNKLLPMIYLRHISKGISPFMMDMHVFTSSLLVFSKILSMIALP